MDNGRHSSNLRTITPARPSDRDRDPVALPAGPDRRTMSGPSRGVPDPSATMPSPKVRLRFAKRGDLRLVSHHDLMRCLERMARRAELPLAQSQGFNPRPKIAFTLALALGIEGHHEVVEMELAEPMEPSEVLRRLAAVSPPGLDWLDAEAPARAEPPRPRRSATPCPSPPIAETEARAALADFPGQGPLALHPAPARPHRRDRPAAVPARSGPWNPTESSGSA